MKKVIILFCLVFTAMVSSSAETVLAISVTGNADFYYVNFYKEPVLSGFSIEGVAKSDSPFCELRLGGEFGIFGMGAYIVGEYGFACPLITFDNAYCLKIVATPALGIANYWFGNIGFIGSFELGFENKIFLSDKWNLFVTPSVKAIALPTILSIPISVGIEYSESRK